MQAPFLALDTTIADIARTLANPKAYVRGVFENMHACKQEKGSAFVRIGTTGRGIVPHYRVSPDTHQMLDDEVLLNPQDDRWSDLFVAFNGRNHRRLPWASKE